LPNDAPWSELSEEVLQEQCAVRDLATTGDTRELYHRLLAYKDDNISDRRRSPWLLRPRRPADYEKHCKEAEAATLQIVRIEDMSGSGRYLNKHFTITDEEGALFTLSFSKEPACTCHAGTAHFRYVNITCVHIIYVMRFVLNSPEPYRWQDAFLSSELESIYCHSHAVQTLLTTGWGNPNNLCILCFRDLGHSFSTSTVICTQCGRAIHTACVYAVKRVRQPIQDGQCYICEDQGQWGIEKYCEQREVGQAVPVNTAITSAVTQPAGLIGQPSFDSTLRDNGRISSSVGDFVNEQLNNIACLTSHRSSPGRSSSSPLSDPSSPGQPLGKQQAASIPDYQQSRLQQSSKDIDNQQQYVDSWSWAPPSIPQPKPILPKATPKRISTSIPQSNTPIPLPVLEPKPFLPKATPKRISSSIPQSNTPVPLPVIAFAWKEQKQKEQQQQQQQQQDQIPTRKATPAAAGPPANKQTPAADESSCSISARIQSHERKLAKLKREFERLADESKRARQELKAMEKQRKKKLKEMKKTKRKAKRELKKLEKKGKKLKKKFDAEP
ncbi:hypothetical protein QBC45DRAFT_328098, partial [Copromyces sp. CBS 386.78]